MVKTIDVSSQMIMLPMSERYLFGNILNEWRQFADEMMAGGHTPKLFVDDVKVNAWYQFPWLAWKDPDEIAEAADKLFQQNDVKFFPQATGTRFEWIWKNISAC